MATLSDNIDALGPEIHQANQSDWGRLLLPYDEVAFASALWYSAAMIALVKLSAVPATLSMSAHHHLHVLAPTLESEFSLFLRTVSTSIKRRRDVCLHLIAVASSGSALIGHARALSNYMTRTHGADKGLNGRVVFMNNCYGSAIPSDPFFAHAGSFFQDTSGELFGHVGDVFILPTPEFTTILDDTLTLSEQQCLDALNRIKTKTPTVSVLVLELFCHRDMQSFRVPFLLALRKQCDELNIAIWLDDTLVALRCGALFSYLHFPGFQPDVVAVGKHFLMSALFVVRTVLIREKDLGEFKVAFSGVVTSQMDSLVFVKSIRFVQYAHETRLDQACFQVGHSFEKHIRSQLVDTVASQSCVFRGIGTIWFISGFKFQNLDLRPSQSRVFLTHRHRVQEFQVMHGRGLHPASTKVQSCAKKKMKFKSSQSGRVWRPCG